MARLIREGGEETRRVCRPDGHVEQYARPPRWRVRFVVFYPDGNGVKMSRWVESLPVVYRIWYTLCIKGPSGRNV